MIIDDGAISPLIPSPLPHPDPATYLLIPDPSIANSGRVQDQPTVFNGRLGQLLVETDHLKAATSNIIEVNKTYIGNNRGEAMITYKSVTDGWIDRAVFWHEGNYLNRQRHSQIFTLTFYTEHGRSAPLRLLNVKLRYKYSRQPRVYPMQCILFLKFACQPSTYFSTNRSRSMRMGNPILRIFATSSSPL